jgi:hypothetical protein
MSADVDAVDLDVDKNTIKSNALLRLEPAQKHCQRLADCFANIFFTDCLMSESRQR